MNMEIITSAASTALANIVLAVIALAGAYAVYYIRLAGAQVKAQTKKIEDESARALLEDALDDVERLATKAVGYTERFSRNDRKVGEEAAVSACLGFAFSTTNHKTKAEMETTRTNLPHNETWSQR